MQVYRSDRDYTIKEYKMQGDGIFRKVAYGKATFKFEVQRALNFY